MPNIKSIGIMVSKVEGRGPIDPLTPFYIRVTFLGLCFLGLILRRFVENS